MLSKELERTLHRTLEYANELHHEFATLEHFLAALTEDHEAIPVLLACGADPDRLRREVRDYVDNELANLVAESEGDDAKPTASFQRVLQRAAILVQSSGKEDVTGANALVAMFAESESHAAYFLHEHKITRSDVINYINSVPAVPRRSHSKTSIIRNYLSTYGEFTVTPPTDFSKKIFISYCHKDLRWISRLEVHMRPIVDAGLVVHWDDRKIKPGSKWRDEIRLAIDASSIAILMISADYLASEFITKKEIPPLLKAAEERGCQILPIILSPCRFLRTPSLAEFQAVNSASRPLSAMRSHQSEAVFVRVAETIEDFLRLAGKQ
jgi:hypothetical protein